MVRALLCCELASTSSSTRCRQRVGLMAGVMRATTRTAAGCPRTQALVWGTRVRRFHSEASCAASQRHRGDIITAPSCEVYNGTQPLPVNLLYNIDDDPSEQHDIASSEPALLNALLTRLAEYNETNVPCCICTGSSRTSEMDVPPRDGYWYSFIDQTPNHDPNCQLQGA